MSNHSVEVVSVALEKHPNADSLSIVKIGGFQAVVRTAEWEGVTKGAYCMPDTLVPVTRPEFAFLASKAYNDAQHPYDGHARIRTIRLRGVWSEGLLVKLPPELADAPVGTDVAEKLACRWYEPLEYFFGKIKGVAEDSEGTEGFDGDLRKYDIENLKRYLSMFDPGETVVATEKLHGSNLRARWDSVNQRLWVGSRSMWKKRGTEAPEPAGSAFWRAVEQDEALVAYLKANPHLVVFGELLGTQTFKYGLKPGEVKVVLFDIYNTMHRWWVSADEFDVECAQHSLTRSPTAYLGPFDFEALLKQAEGPSVFNPEGTPCREGLVIRPIKERNHPHNGRVILKLVGQGYLEKS